MEQAKINFEETGMMPNELVQIRAHKDRIQQASPDTQRLKDEFNSANDNAVEAKQQLSEIVQDFIDGDKGVVNKFKVGEVGDGISLRHHAKITQTYTQEVLKIYKDHPERIPVAHDSIGGKVTVRVVQKIISPSMEIDAQSTPYVYELMYKAINNQLQDVNSLYTAFQDIRNLQSYNELLFEKIRSVIVSVAEETGVSRSEIEDRLNRIAPKRKLNEREEYEQDIKTKVTAEERGEFRILGEKIRNALAEDVRVGNRLTAEQRMQIMYFQSGHVDNPGLLQQAFQLLNIPPQEWHRYGELFQKSFPQENWQNIKGMMTNKELQDKLAEASMDFSKDGLERLGILKFDRTTGKYDLDLQGYKKVINQHYFGVLQTLHANPSKMWNEIFDPYQHGYYFQGVKGLVSTLCNQLETLEFNDRGGSLPRVKLESYLKDVKGRYQASMLSYAELFHNLPLYARDPSSFEKWGQFLGYLFPSELAEVFDPQDPIMEVARREIAMHLRRRVALNGNKIPTDLFAGKYDERTNQYGQSDRDKMKITIRERMKSVTGVEPKEWELERAVTYGLGIGIANLMDPEVICTADANVDFNFKGIYPLASALSAKQNWGVGRGWPASGLFPDLMAMEIELFPQHGLWKRIFKKKSWVPKTFHKFVETQQRKYQSDLMEITLGKGSKYQELVGMINIATSINSRHGWRVSPIKDALKGFMKGNTYGFVQDIDRASEIVTQNGRGWGNREWGRYMDLAMRLYGGSAMWWMVGDRVSGELKRYLAQQLGSYDKMEEEFEEYELKEKSRSKKFDVNIGGRNEKKSFAEIRQMRIYQIRGQTFEKYYRRNPGDFLMLLSQTCPQLLDLDVNYFQSEHDLKHFLEHDATQEKHEKDVGKALAVRETLEKRWGSEQFATMGRVRTWLLSMVAQYQNETGPGRRFADKKAVIDYFVRESGTAFEKAVNDHTEDAGLAEGKPKRGRDYVRPDDFSDPTIRESVFGANGFSTLLRQQDFGGFDENGAFRVGEAGFFYRMGEIWTMKQTDINPFAADLNHFRIYENMGLVGEDVPKRYLGDAEAVNKMIQKVAKLDELLLSAAKSGDMKEIFELHHMVFSTLKGIIGKEYAQRANYILAQVVSQFFLEHSSLRGALQPAILRPLASFLLLGQNSSLSKIVTENLHALSWDSNGVRDYFKKLFELDVIPKEGLWSMDQLGEVFDADTKAFMIGEAVPNFIYFMILFLLWSYIKKAFEESEGKKK